MSSKSKLPSDGGGDYQIPVLDSRFSNHEVLIASGDVRDGRAGADQARQLITQFVAEAFTSEGPSQNLIVHVRDALAEYLTGGKTMESAFRVKQGRRGRPYTGKERDIEIAVMMLVMRVVDGETFEESTEATSRVFHRSRSTICKAFEKYKGEALRRLSSGHRPRIDANSPEQKERLAVIFPWL